MFTIVPAVCLQFIIWVSFSCLFIFKSQKFVWLFVYMCNNNVSCLFTFASHLFVYICKSAVCLPYGQLLIYIFDSNTSCLFTFATKLAGKFKCLTFLMRHFWPFLAILKHCDNAKKNGKILQSFPSKEMNSYLKESTH